MFVNEKEIWKLHDEAVFQDFLRRFWGQKRNNSWGSFTANFGGLFSTIMEENLTA